MHRHTHAERRAARRARREPAGARDLAGIPVVDSAAVDEIPEGLVLLPEPRPLPRWRGPALAAIALLTGATSLLIAISGPEPARDGGEPTGLASTSATLASANEKRSAAQGEQADPSVGRSQAADAEDHAKATPEAPAADTREPRAGSPTADDHGPSGGTAPSEAVDAGAEDEEAAIGSSGATTEPADGAQEGGEAEPVLPDAADLIDEVDDVVDEVTDALPIPDVLGD